MPDPTTAPTNPPGGAELGGGADNGAGEVLWGAINTGKGLRAEVSLREEEGASVPTCLENLKGAKRE